MMGIGGMLHKSNYWFRSRRYGWGWGLPVRWQGWLTYGAGLILLISNFYVFPPTTDLLPFLASTWSVIIALVAICFWKGEPLVGVGEK